MFVAEEFSSFFSKLEGNTGDHKFTDCRVLATNVADNKVKELVSTPSRRSHALTCGTCSVEKY
jgi:hypothetical protein